MSAKSSPMFVGVDLHTKSFTACFMRSDGSNYLRTYQLKQWDANKFRSKLGQHVQIAVETTTTTGYFEMLFEADVEKIVRVNTRKFKLISQSLKKTDRNDARTLAFYLKQEVLPESRKKTVLQEETMRACNLHERWTGHRTRELNSIRDVYVRNGMALEGDALSSRKKLLALDFSGFNESDRLELDLHRDMAIVMTDRLKTVNNRIAELAVQLPGFKEIIKIKGVGIYTAAVVLAIIGDIRDFANKKKLCSYFGLVPSVRQSEATIHHGRTAKRGNKLARKVLIQSALIAKEYSLRLSGFHSRIKDRRGSGKANVALARKLLDIFFDVLTKGWSDEKEMSECRAA